MRNLETSGNSEATKVIEEAIKKANDSNAGRDVEALTMHWAKFGNGWTRNFCDAWDHSNKKLEWNDIMQFKKV